MFEVQEVDEISLIKVSQVCFRNINSGQILKISLYKILSQGIFLIKIKHKQFEIIILL